jgi:hypothetical protein
VFVEEYVGPSEVISALEDPYQKQQNSGLGLHFSAGKLGVEEKVRARAQMRETETAIRGFWAAKRTGQAWKTPCFGTDRSIP